MAAQDSEDLRDQDNGGRVAVPCAQRPDDEDDEDRECRDGNDDDSDIEEETEGEVAMLVPRRQAVRVLGEVRPTPNQRRMRRPA